MAQAGKPDRADQRVAGGKGAVRLDASQRKHEEGADRERRDQLGDGRQLQPIVEETDREHRQAGEEDRQPLDDVGLEQRPRRADSKADDGCRRDRDATHRRRRRAVPAVGPRRDDGAVDCARRRTASRSHAVQSHEQTQ